MMPLSKGEPAPFGLFRDDTRYLSGWQVYINGTHPRLLASEIDKGFTAKFVYGNSKVGDLPEQSLMLSRDLVIADGLYEQLVVTNFNTHPVDCEIAIVFDADFADMFEVRGSKRPARGTTSGAKIESDKSEPGQAAMDGKNVSMAYTGLDKYTMRTLLRFRSPGVEPTITNATPQSQMPGTIARFPLHLKARESQSIETSCRTWTDARFAGSPYMSGEKQPYANFAEALSKAQSDYQQWRADGATITTSDTALNDILDRAYRDLYILRQGTPRGTCLAAGTPWFACAFGRDQAVTALEMLVMRPDLAREVITILAAYQGTKHDNYTEERPGKILHELRLGEMARLGEIPFKPYYGTVDATPLWLMLVVRYARETGDMQTIKQVWPNVERALAYLDTEIGDNGYLRYGGKPGAALSNQGWKDSGDAVMYANGQLARAPIALCEPQGYVYEAWSGLAEIAAQLGHGDLSVKLANRASALKNRFNQDFWMPEKKFVALALDGQGKQCDVISSNPGHLLATGILDDERARAVAGRMMQPDMFCGWGIRTLSASEAAYNPMSYHNGSVWPHDNALAVEGLSSVGMKVEAYKVMEGLKLAAQHQADMRLPELFCGFPRKDANAPIRYPVSCVPQAWAAGSMFLILSSCLGIKPDAPSKTLRISHPYLPEWLDSVAFKGLKVGDGKVDLRFCHTSDGGTVAVTTGGETYTKTGRGQASEKTRVEIVRNEGNVSVKIE